MMLRLGSNLILSRLLAPDAYGLITVIWTMLVALGLFSDMGIQRTVVQSPNAESGRFLNTAWTLQILRGAMLSLILLLVAVVFAVVGGWGWLPQNQIYGDDRLPGMIGVMALFMAVNGFQSTRGYLAQRHMQQKVLSLMGLGVQAVSIVVCVLVAWLTRSHWTLVVGSLLPVVLARILERRLLKGPPERFEMDRDALNELLGQAKWLMPASALAFMAMHADRLILGGLIDAHTYGLYAIAYMLAGTATSVANVMVTNIAFPALSEVARTRPHDMAKVLERFIWLFDAIFVTGFVALSMCGELVVDILYDERYTEVGWMLGILALGGIGFRSQLMEQCYLAQARPHYTAMAQVCRLTMMVSSIYIGNRLDGLHGVLIGLAISQGAGLPLAYYYRIRNGLYTLRSDALLVPAIAVGVAAGWGLVTLAGVIRN